MTTNKGRGEIEFCDIILGGVFIILGRTSQIWAAHLMISLTMADAPTHVLPGHAGVGAGVVGLVPNVLAVLVGVITPRSRRGVAGRGHGQRPTFFADSITIRVRVAALPWLEAAVPIIIVGLEPVSSAIAVDSPQADALIPAHLGTSSVVAGVREGEDRVSRHRSSQHQQ